MNRGDILIREMESKLKLFRTEGLICGSASETRKIFVDIIHDGIGRVCSVYYNPASKMYEYGEAI